MYKRHLRQMSLLDNPESFGGITLDGDNEWCKLAQMIPWYEFKDDYADLFPSGTGQPAYSLQMALGTLLIEERYHFSDEETTEQLAMNPYFQYFIGLEAFSPKAPFDSSMLTRFRKRITPEMLARVNDIIIGRPEAKTDDHDGNNSGGSGSGENEGTLILDATCAPQNIRFPTDASLLNEARMNAEAIIDVLHENGLTGEGKKPRTYRDKARKQ